MITRLVRSRVAFAAVAACSFLVSCSEGPLPPVELTLRRGVVVSDLVPDISLGAGALVGSALPGSSADDVAYVSLPSGTVRNGTFATITVPGGSGSIVTSVFEGGFDPVAIRTGTADSVDVVVSNAAGEIALHARVPVRSSRPPVVIRTIPPRKKTDIALNARIAVTFSEPIDSLTVKPPSIRLQRGTTLVAGTVQFLDATQITVVFVPDSSLEPGTEYQLIVTTQVRDLDGDRLASPDTVAFTTGQSSTTTAASIRLSPDSVLSLVSGATYQLRATVRDAAGNLLTGQQVLWTSSDPRGLAVSSAGRLTALGDGNFSVTASVGTVSRTITVGITAGETASVSVSPMTASVAAGDTTLLTAVVRDAAGRVINHPSVSWTTSEATVARVLGLNTPTGMVIGVSLGSVTITAASGTARGTAAVTVGNPVAVATVTIAPESPKVLVQASAQLAATLRDVTGRALGGRAVTWASNNPAVATVDANGRVTGVSIGTTLISATSEAVSGTASVAVGTVNFSSVSAGGSHTCALTIDKVAYCWGDNTTGQLGINLTSSDYFLVPHGVAGGLSFSNVSAGDLHTCAVTTTGTAYCWGNNDDAELGIGGWNGPESCTSENYHVMSCSRTPVTVAGGLTFSTVTSGGYHSCGLTTSGMAYCWGGNYYGQLGVGHSASVPLPAPVTGGLTFTELFAGGDNHTCGLTKNGAAYCWGDNSYGQLGNGSKRGFSNVPVAVTGGLVFATLSVGWSHTCGVTTARIVYCWGDHRSGQLGIATTDAPEQCFGHASGGPCSSMPMAVNGGLQFTALSSGGAHTCGITPDGTAFCWGLNRFGVLGIGHEAGPEQCFDGTVSAPCSRKPVAVSGGFTFKALDMGLVHTCGLTRDGSLYCWGQSGLLGSGNPTSSSVPVKVAGQR